MSRTYAPLITGIWQDNDFTALSQNAQHVYLLAMSQPDINYCGVVSVTVKRWCRYSADVTPEQVVEGLDQLQRARFIVVDDDTEELWIRSFVKHNKVLLQPKVAMAMRDDYQDIHSMVIKTMFYESLPPDEKQKLQKPSPEPLAKGMPKGIGNPSERVSDTRSFDQRLSVNKVNLIEPEPEPEPQPQPSPPTDDDEDEAKLKKATEQIALARRDAQPPGSISHPQRWLEKVRAALVDEYRDKALGWLADHHGATVDQLVNHLEPVRQPRGDPLEATVAARKAKIQTDQAQLERPCPFCDRGRVWQGDGTVADCGSCHGSGIASQSAEAVR